MKNFKLTAPWIEFINKLKAMFGQDPEIKIVYDDDTAEVRLLVSNSMKAEALTKLLPDHKTFGNFCLAVTVVPADKDNDEPRSLLLTAFAGNPVFREINTVSEGSFNAVYALFEKEVVQYYNDNLGDPAGMNHTLYQTIAKDIFVEMPGVFFTTEIIPDYSDVCED